MPAAADLFRAIALAAIVAGGAACGSETEAETPSLRAGSVSVTSRAGSALTVSAVDPIKLGKNDLGIRTLDRGVEVVTVSALMPAHGHGTKPPVVERTADGYRVKELVLYMSGRWEVRLALRAGGRDDEALLTVDVP